MKLDLDKPMKKLQAVKAIEKIKNKKARQTLIIFFVDKYVAESFKKPDKKFMKYMRKSKILSKDMKQLEKKCSFL